MHDMNFIRSVVLGVVFLSDHHRRPTEDRDQRPTKHKSQCSSEADRKV